jgi:cell wall-associated NlpC family hydrolase
MLMNKPLIFAMIVLIASCKNITSTQQSNQLTDTTDHTQADQDTFEKIEALPPTSSINTGNVKPGDLVEYAKTLLGTPYQYGSINPEQGFDCSGFITYVFNHFQIAVPRSSRDFTNAGTEIPVTESQPGDLILFTGTDSTKRDVGHMGIIVENSDSTKFIHSTSGRAYGVTVTPLNKSYQDRFVKTIRIF